MQTGKVLGISQNNGSKIFHADVKTLMRGYTGAMENRKDRGLWNNQILVVMCCHA